MNKKIVDFIKKYYISDLEIKDIVNISPMMDVVSYEEFMENVSLLVKYGYPEVDLDVLLLSKPYLFSGSPKDLEKDLRKLKAKYDDIEEILKQDPTII